MDSRVSVVIVTRNRRASLLTTLQHLQALPEAPRALVVDNGSSDGTVAAVGAVAPWVDVIALPRNRGSAARTIGVRRAATPYVAFSDDDSWWAPGALARAADLLDAYPTLAVVAARVLVGSEERLDPVCAEMAASPLPAARGSPGPSVLGFVACGAVVRREAYLAVGGFHPRFGIGGEEELLAMDLAAHGWTLAYVEDVIAHHHPSPARDPARRRRIVTRNALWCTWLRRPPRAAWTRTGRLLAPALRDAARREGALDAARGLPWVLRQRRVLPARVERLLRLLESA